MVTRKSKDKTIESTDRSVNQENTSTAETTQIPFDKQFDQKFDWRFLKNTEYTFSQQMRVVEDVDNAGVSQYRLIGDGVILNALFDFTILEMSVSWNAVPGVDVEYQVLKIPPGIDISAGTAITWSYEPKNGLSTPLVQTDTPIIPTAVGQGIPAEDDVNIYIPVSDNINYSFERCDRLGIVLINPPADISTIGPITYTFRVRLQKF